MRTEISGCETGEATTRVNCMCRMRINVMLDLAWHTRRAFLSIITCGWDGMEWQRKTERGKKKNNYNVFIFARIIVLFLAASITS